MSLVWFIVTFIAFTTFFAGITAAFVYSNKLRIEIDIKHGGVTSQILQLFLKHQSLFATAMMIGYYISLLLLAVFALLLIHPFVSFHTPYPFLALSIDVFVISFIVIATSELFSRTIVRLSPNIILNLFSLPILICFIIFSPFGWLILTFGKWVLKTFLRGKNVSDATIIAKVDFSRWLRDKHAQQNDTPQNNQELKIFQNALEFSKVRIRDCMIPRTEVEAIDINANIDALRQKFISSGYSKIIVYRNTIDNIVGYVNSKELFKHPATIKEKLNQIAFVPETMPASKLLHDFMQYHRSIAVVVDEYGGTSGIVSLEDIMEEIFGEIEDEHDTDDLVEKQVNKSEFILSGRLETEYLNSEFNLRLPDSEDYDTLAGFILYHHHNLPKPNDLITIGAYTFKILKVSNTRIELVHLKLTEE